MQHWTKICHSKDENLDKIVAILDKKGAALTKIFVLNIVREINCKSPLQKARPNNC